MAAIGEPMDDRARALAQGGGLGSEMQRVQKNAQGGSSALGNESLHRHAAPIRLRAVGASLRVRESI